MAKFLTLSICLFAAHHEEVSRGRDEDHEALSGGEHEDHEKVGFGVSYILLFGYSKFQCVMNWHKTRAKQVHIVFYN